MNDPQQVHHYDGPVFNGGVSNSQFAWNNETATQNQQLNNTVAPGHEALATLVTDLLRQLPGAGLGDREREDAESAAQEVPSGVRGRGDRSGDGRARDAGA
ncbi:hypothetical protein, partial [Streptomyces sp. NPDC005486]|uniref:hypothetical protein n=1 Tax=Streptomyces sp. NPDC005486 TaxID=3155345 RepID=UPI0033BE04B6